MNTYKLEIRTKRYIGGEGNTYETRTKFYYSEKPIRVLYEDGPLVQVVFEDGQALLLTKLDIEFLHVAKIERPAAAPADVPMCPYTGGPRANCAVCRSFSR